MFWVQQLKGGLQKTNHAAVVVGNKIFTFGGYRTEERRMYASIDVHVFDTKHLSWREIDCQGLEDAPPPVFGHSSVACGHLIFMWGGTNELRNSTRKMYCFDTTILGWLHIPAKGSIPQVLDGHTDMYIFGGFEQESEELKNLVYRIDLRNYIWEHVPTGGSFIIFRDFHTSSVIGDRMYIFGGRSMDFSTHYPSDLYDNNIAYLDTKTMNWVIPMCSGDIPEGRRSHSAVVYRGEIYIFGGVCQRSHLVHLNDMYKFNPISCVWSRLKVRGDYPSPRRRHCCVTVQDRLFLFGGSSSVWEDEEEVESEEMELIENDDMHILEFNPTLKRMCQLIIIKFRFVLDCLPKMLQEEINVLSTRECPVVSL